MKFTIKKDEFLKRITTVIGATPDGKPSLPILANLLLIVKDGIATLSATDLTTELSTSFAVTDSENGTLALPAKKTEEIIKELPDGDIHLIVKENYHFTIKAGKANFNIVGQDGSEFPKLQTPDTSTMATFGAEGLGKLLGQVRFSICKDETKFNLCGAHVSVQDGKLKFAATNGHRLTVSEREKELPENFLPKEGIIIPTKGVGEIIKLTDKCPKGGEVSVAYKGNSLYVSSDDVKMAVRLVDGTYPEYSKAIPTTEGQTAIISKADLMKCLKRIGLISEKDNRASLTFATGQLNISSSNKEMGDAVEELSIKYEGVPFNVSLNSRYALEALAALDKEEEVRITLHKEAAPVTIQGIAAGFLAVIMPMRA